MIKVKKGMKSQETTFAQSINVSSLIAGHPQNEEDILLASKGKLLSLFASTIVIIDIISN